MKTIMDIFKKKAEIVGEKAAIYFNDTSVSYKELDILSDKLAKYLIQSGVKENNIIPIFCEPSIERIVGLFAILKAGAAYLPIPVDSTRERIDYLIKDSGTDIIVSDRTNKSFQGVRSIDIKSLDYSNLDNSDIEKRNGEIAYVIYTSGSTGKPKGVKVSHSNLMYVLNNMQKYYSVTPEDKYLLNTPYSFDVSVVEIFGWILGEGSLVVSELETKKKYDDLINMIGRYNITHLSFSPSIIRLVYQLFSEKDIQVINENVKYLMFAGEEFQYEYAKKSLETFNNVKIFNLYGPTEATVYATRYEVDKRILEKKYVPIGIPLDGANIKIMDKNGQEVKEGEKGEIYIYGDGVAIGYHNVTLNNDRFSTDCHGDRFYRTGDIGKIDEDGNIKFLGRNDNQVQIHGIRVELGEIENVLLRLEGVMGICVVYEKNQLIAFIEGNEKLSIDSIKDKLSNVLPKYMIPTRMLVVREFPMNTNRKVDRKKLLHMINNNDNAIEKEVLEGNSLIISKLFNKVLGVEVNNSKEDFFDLGGDSLNGIHLLSLLEKEFNIEFRNDFLYSYSTINAISDYVTKIKNEIKESEILKGTENSCVIDREMLKKELADSYERNSQNMRKGKLKEYNSFFFQRVYRNIKFDSKINVEIFIDKKVTIIEIKKAVEAIIRDNSVFRVFLKEKVDNIVFLENQDFDAYTLAKYNMNCGVGKHSEYQKIINEELNNSLKIYNEKYLLYNMILVEYMDGYVMNIALDHNIADLSCVHILKKKFNSILKGKDLDRGIDYHEFINITEQNNQEDLLSQEYTIKVDEANKGVDKSKLKEIENGILVLKKPIENVSNNEWYINEASYIVGQIGCYIFNAPAVSINVILNLRKIKGMDISELVGDVHTIGTMIVNKEDSRDEYEKYIKNEFDKFYIDDGKNPMHVIYKNLPIKEEYQKQIEKIYVSDIPINLNYVGQIKEKEIGDFYNNLVETKKKLDKFEVKMLKTTVVTTDKNMYIFLLKKPVISIEILNEIGLENIEMETES
ncbi:hypothetical protein AN1V17_01170 [Vallitalea sediminicola]